MTTEIDQAPAVESNPAEDLLNALGGPPEQEEVEASAEGEQEQEEAQEPEQQEESPSVSQKFRVKVKSDDGQDEERDLSLEELAAGYMLQADYTRKTQATAAQEKQRQEQVIEAIQQTTQQARQQLAALQQFVMASVAPELNGVNWVQLAQEDPARYVQLQAKAQQVHQTLGQIQAQDNQLKQQEHEALKQRREQAHKHSLDYLSKEIPGFNLEKDGPRLSQLASKLGYSGKELEEISDHRFITLLHQAAKWQELQTAKPKAMQKVADAPKVVKPSAPQPRKTNQAAMDRLKKTGRPSELVNFL